MVKLTNSIWFLPTSHKTLFWQGLEPSRDKPIRLLNSSFIPGQEDYDRLRPLSYPQTVSYCDVSFYTHSFSHFPLPLCVGRLPDMLLPSQSSIIWERSCQGKFFFGLLNYLILPHPFLLCERSGIRRSVTIVPTPLLSWWALNWISGTTRRPWRSWKRSA